MIRWILITVLTIGLIGVGVWGYQEHREKNAVLIQAENTYQRSFHELSYHMDLLNDKIGTALAMNSRDTLSPQLVEIWRITSDALSNVGQLPLSLLPFNKTEEFLSNIGDFTYKTAVRDLGEEPLSDKETKTLESLYKQSGDLTKELRQVQHVVLDNNLRWMDVQLALASDEAQSDNTIIDGLKTVEKKVEGFPESNVNATSSEEHNFKFLSGDKISQKDALKQSKDLFNVNNADKLTITKSGKGADVPLYSVSYKDGDKNGYLDLAQKGGKPISLIVDRPVSEKQISLHEGLNKAEKYLQTYDFENMKIFQSSQFDNIGVYSFLYNDDGVRIYSDSIEVKVGLDKGDVLGFTARNYYMNHADRDIPEPKISKKEAKKKVNPEVKINEEHLAVIDNDIGEEVLTYEFLGVLGNDTYRIFVNAMNGTEEKVEKLGGTELKFAGNF
ncbi:germination protein YpeB [Lentibacillus sp. Marseille-P4043]|uniref:germination protein YpeB n=1 Tax=Lentibacillus sp. Marseille-P4043 TaxID=2040293 RepID=UPI000D0ADED0|nr:germination protein YpeB [Lentibacillus sp. Marseille-P4043]